MKCREIAVENDVFNKGVEILIGSCGVVTDVFMQALVT